MTLLAPITAIVAGAIGGSLLLVLYMLRLRRRPVRVSSIMFWGDPPRDLEANVPLRMVKPAWTLLLQALAVALLALALGRPAIDAVGGSSDRLYLLIDRSASMSARDAAGGQTRLEAAKARALDIIAGVGGLGGAEAMVIPFASRASGATGMTSDRGVLAEAVRGIEPTDESGDLDAAMALVSALIASEAAEGATASGTRVVLLSDGAFAEGVTRNLAGAQLEFRPVVRGGDFGSAEGGAGLGGSGLATGESGGGLGQTDGAGFRDNVAVVALAARRDAEEPSRVRVFARLISMRSQPTPATLVLTIDGRELARRAIVVPAASRAEVIEPGEQSVALEFLHVEGGVLRAGIDRADTLVSDNQGAVVLPGVKRASILLVAPAEPDFFLQNVLEELGNAQVRVIDEAMFLGPLGAELAAEGDLIVFDRVRPDRAPSKPTLSIGAGMPVPGLDIAEPHADAAAGDRETPTRSTGAAQWDRTHPALSGVTLDALFVSAPLRLERASERAGVRVLASGRDGPLVVESRADGFPRAVVAFALHDSNWPVLVGFPVFIASSVEHLVYGGDPGRGLSSRAGEAIAPDALRADATGGGAASARATPPTGATITAYDESGRSAASGAGSIILERAGVYTLRAEGVAEGTLIAVNLGDEFESRLGASDRVSIAGEAVSGTTGAPRPRELWFWFVLAAGIVLIVEWFVYLAVARA